MSNQDRSILLNMKAEEIKRQLAKWASEKYVLKVGEQLVFSLRIEPMPIVSRDMGDATALLLDTPATEFFSRKEFLKVGIGVSIAGRTARFIEGVAKTKKSERVYRISDFLKQFPSREFLRSIDRVGPKMVDAIVLVVQAAGLPPLK